MATIINGPMGISESQLMSKSAPTMTSAMYHKRAELKAMLIQKLCQMQKLCRMQKPFLMLCLMQMLMQMQMRNQIQMQMRRKWRY